MTNHNCFQRRRKPDRIPLSELAQRLSTYIDALVPELLPAARRSGGWFVVGSVAGEVGSSLRISRRSGRWTDAATGERGDLLDLVGAVLGLDLGAAASWARSWIGLSDDPLPPPQATPPVGPVPSSVDDAQRTATALRLWRRAQPAPGTLVQRYLEHRGITLPPPPSLRFLLEALHGPTGLRLPCMLSAVAVWPVHDVTAVHRTFLRADGHGKADVIPAKMSFGPLAGGAVRLGPAGPELVVGEGIESTLTAAMASGLPAWAALSTSGMRSLILPDPPLATVVHVAVDHDEPGIAAAEALAARAVAEGRKVILHIPGRPGSDWNDEVRDAAA